MAEHRKRFIPNRNFVVLRFEDPELADLEVVGRKPSMDNFLKIMRLQDALEGLDDIAEGTRITPEQMRQLDELFTLFGRFLKSWNIDDPDTGDPVPADAGGLKSLELGLAMQVIEAWGQAVAQAPPPLPSGSSGGATSPEAQIPMEDLSPSPGS